MIVEYMSPTSLSLWESDPEAWFRRYGCKQYSKQTPAMSVGSAFDAFVKAHITGADVWDLLKSQVEEHNRQFAYEAGRRCFDAYRESGAMADLAQELGTAVSKPKCEFGIKLVVGGVPIYGKPDLFFQNQEGVRLVYDWKVNGYCSKASPKKGYVRIRPGGQAHRDSVPMMWKGVLINVACKFEEIDSQWADQLATYAWLSGEEVGSEDWVVGIDQLACDGTDAGGVRIRVAAHRSRISREWQAMLLQRYMAAWSIINSGWLFRNLSEKDSKQREELLRASINDVDMKRMLADD